VSQAGNDGRRPIPRTQPLPGNLTKRPFDDAKAGTPTLPPPGGVVAGFRIKPAGHNIGGFCAPGKEPLMKYEHIDTRLFVALIPADGSVDGVIGLRFNVGPDMSRRFGRECHASASTPTMR